MLGLITMEPVVAVAIGVLAAIFVGSLIAVVVICSNRKCRKTDYFSRQQRETRQDAVLVDNMEGSTEANSTDVELDRVGINANIEEILHDNNWVTDAPGLVPHCLAILRICHSLTEKLVGMTMGNSQQLRNPESLNDMVTIARRISPRVDDVMRAMYPPLDPRLLEARCTALALSVSHLVLITKNACRLSGVMDWIDQSMADVEDHLKVLREASANFEMARPTTETTTSQQISNQQPQQQQQTPQTQQQQMHQQIQPMNVLPGPDVTDFTVQNNSQNTSHRETSEA